MPLYATILLAITGIGLIALNAWYLRRNFKARSLDESFGFDTDSDHFVKPGRRDDSRLQFWILTIGNVFGLFLAFVIILSFITNDVTILVHYLESHPSPAH